MSERGPITRALIRALRAVENGEVVRKAGRRDSKLHGPRGVGSQTLWLAKMNGFIADGKETSGAMIRITKQVLTDAGKAALASAQPRPTPDNATEGGG